MERGTTPGSAGMRKPSRRRSKEAAPWRREGAPTRWRQPVASSRWRPEGSSARRSAMAIAFVVVPGLLAICGLVLLAPPTPEFDPALALSLGIISGLAYIAEIRLKPGI